MSTEDLPNEVHTSADTLVNNGGNMEPDSLMVMSASAASEDKEEEIIQASILRP